MDSLFATPDHEVDSGEDGVQAVVDLLNLLGESTQVEPEKQASALERKTVEVTYLERALTQSKREHAQAVAEFERKLAAAAVLPVVTEPSFEAPTYDMEVVARDGNDRARHLRFVPSVNGTLAAAIEQKLIPAPLPYDAKIVAVDVNNRPLRVKLTPTRMH